MLPSFSLSQHACRVYNGSGKIIQIIVNVARYSLARQLFIASADFCFSIPTIYIDIIACCNCMPHIPYTTLIHNISAILDTIPEPCVSPTCTLTTTTHHLPPDEHWRHPRTHTHSQHKHMQH